MQTGALFTGSVRGHLFRLDEEWRLGKPRFLQLRCENIKKAHLSAKRSYSHYQRRMQIVMTRNYGESRPKPLKEMNAFQQFNICYSGT